MELIIVVGLIVVIAVVASIPAWRYERRTGRKLGRSGAAAGLGAVQELFQPSAANASAVVEEQREARHAVPAPGDPLDRDTSVVIIVDDVK